jgi:hypothetical protein
MREHGVQALLMGGQACVLYGAAEFSRDADFAVLASPENLDRLTGALGELQADVIAVPPYDVQYLERGHAIHFRCKHPEAQGMRVDVMSRLRGVAPFPELWARRTSWDLPEGFQIESLSLPDLVASKKTQRDKDWPMIRRLVEVSYDEGFASPTPERVSFWLRELRTPELLLEGVHAFFEEARRVAPLRPAVSAAIGGHHVAVVEALSAEEAAERERDRIYWSPLKAELEALRHARNRGS